MVRAHAPDQSATAHDNMESLSELIENYETNALKYLPRIATTMPSCKTSMEPLYK